MHKLLFLYVLVKAIWNERKLNLKGQLIQNGHQYAFSDQYYIAAGTQVLYKFQRAKMFLYWFIYSLITVRLFTVVYQTGACSCECCMLYAVRGCHTLSEYCSCLGGYKTWQTRPYNCYRKIFFFFFFFFLFCLHLFVSFCNVKVYSFPLICSEWVKIKF